MEQKNVRDMIRENIKAKKYFSDRAMPYFFMSMAFISVIVTFGIIYTLIFDSVKFFSQIPIKEIFSTDLNPLAQNPTFGFIPLITATLLVTLIAMLVAVPIGMAAAIHLSQFATERKRRILKPVLEVLAGIPTIVYGFFAYSFVTPLLTKLIPGLGAKNILSPGIVMGIMIIPMVASLAEDAMNSVPQLMKDGALGLGSTKLETTFKVIIPASMSGIIAAIVLALSRAIGETMIVTIASGSSKAFSLDITQSMQTMTAYIVEFTSGDAGSGTIGYYSLFAVGLILFLFTLIINLIAQHMVRKYREVY